MKKTLLYVLTLATVASGVMLISSCEEDLGINIGIPNDLEIVYRIDPQTGTTFSRRDTYQVNLDSLLATQEATRDDVESIITSSTQLSITDSLGVVIPTANFSNVKDIQVFLANTTSGTSAIASYDSAAIAGFGTANPITTNYTDLGTSIDVLAYFVDGTFVVGQDLRLNNPITAPVYVKSKITVTVNVKL